MKSLVEVNIKSAGMHGLIILSRNFAKLYGACHYVYDLHTNTCPNFDCAHFRALLKYATNGEFLYKNKLFRKVVYGLSAWANSGQSVYGSLGT